MNVGFAEYKIKSVVWKVKMKDGTFVVWHEDESWMAY